MDTPFRCQQARGDRLFRGIGARGLITAHWQLQQATDQRADRVLALAGAKIEDQAAIVVEAASLGVFAELLQQPRLSNAGLASDQDGFALAPGLAAFHGLREARAFLVAPNEGGCSDMTGIVGHALYLPNFDRFGQSHDLARAQQVGLNTLAQTLRDGGGGIGLAGARQVGQSGCQVYRFSGNRIGLVVFAAHAAGHDLPGSNTDVDRQRRLDGLGYRMQFARRPNRPLRIIGVGHRRTKYCHHRIADMFIDGAAIAQHRRIRDGEKAVQQVMGGFAAQPLGQSGKSGYIGKQYGNLAAFRLHGGHCLFNRWRCRGCRLQRLNRHQHPFPRPQRQAQLAQIGVRDRGQIAHTDFVVDEDVDIFLKIKIDQPLLYVVNHSPPPPKLVAEPCAIFNGMYPE